MIPTFLAAMGTIFRGRLDYSQITGRVLTMSKQ